MMTIFASSSFMISFTLFTFVIPFTTPMPYANPCKDFTCGSFKNLNYPFGIHGSECGDPDFQLMGCDSNEDPSLFFSYEDAVSFRLKNLTNSIPYKGIVQLEILVNSTQSDCSTHLRRLFSSQPLPYGSSYTLDLDESSDVSKYFVCNVNSQGALGSACGFYFFDEKPTCNNEMVPTITLPINSFGYPIFDTLFTQTGLLLEATVPPERIADCADCLGGNFINACGFNGKYEFKCSCGEEACPGGSNEKHNKKNTAAIIGGVVASAGVLLLGLVGIFLWRRSLGNERDISGANSLLASRTSFPQNKDEEHGKNSVGNVPIFSYEELRDATSSFSDRNELGEGGFGIVYHGRLKDGRQVAVKKLYQHHHTKRVDQFLKEANIYTNLLHPNVVRLYGCTRPNSEELLLVFEYVPNGTLADHLHGGRRGDHGGLSLSTRLKIALQTAEALFFLHSNDPPVFHRDVKSLNILLDEHMDAKVADFGLCRPVPVNATHVTTAPQGTPGYVDPEYYQCYQLTEKSDVYSFGVVLVEIISGEMAVDINRERRYINLANMAVSKIQEGALDKLVDPALQSLTKNDEGARDVVTCLVELAFRCLASQRDDRPDMKEVVEFLQDLRGKTDDLKDRKRNSVAPPSPISVHDKWPSVTTTPSNNSADL